MTKKDFKVGENPALTYISGTQTQQTGSKYNTDNTDDTLPTLATDETKSKRLNLLLYPSLFENLKKIAVMQRTSVNDLINTVLNDYTEKEADQIERYNQIFGK